MKNKIALKEPGTDLSRRHFSVVIKNRLESEHCLYPEVKKMMIIADTSGDFHSFKKKLLDKRLIDKKNNWLFSNGHLIIVGNFGDYRNVGNELLWMVYSLEQKAIKHGGYVHFILGYHGIKNLKLDWGSSSPKYAYSTMKKKNSYTLLYDGNLELYRWLLTKNMIEKIGRVIINGGLKNNIASDYNFSLRNISEYKIFGQNKADKKDTLEEYEQELDYDPAILIKKRSAKDSSSFHPTLKDNVEEDYIIINLATHESCTLVLSQTHIRIGLPEKKEKLSL